ncbi:MAG: hypothetical protein KF734_00985 [Saprospiraceae bacterium]|nr:hypothetical protein [Saprospiraceae bacterium]
MKKSLRLGALFLMLVPSCLLAQEATPVSLVADELILAGKIGEAAAQYEQAARLNGDNPVMLYKAAEAYYRVRDYRRAAALYAESKQEYERSELAGLRYARALKQSNRHTEAMEAFKEFARRYKGARKAQIVSVVMSEVKGCELALEMAQQPASLVLPAEVKILPKGVNSIENEFAPVAFSDDLLYFSTLSQGRVQFMRSQRKAGAWQLPTPATGLPESVAARFGSGTFSPDGQRFYCTQCDEPSAEERGGNGLRTRCNIFMLRRNPDGAWSEPERLRDYINLPNHTTTQPFVTQERGRELLFFASDREGGFGGLDLYVCERSLDSDDLDFSFPQNLGNTVNAAGDEVTPFFDPTTQTLWFSSNSHVSVGGLDVFKSVRSAGKWSKPENAGLPVNSPADDFFFTLKKSGNGGYFVSNRLFGTSKTSTRDEDIFEFFPKEPPIVLNGSVLERGTNQPVGGSLVALYQLDANGEQRLLEVRPSANGSFQFALLPDARYMLEVNREGYKAGVVKVLPDDHDVVVLLDRVARLVAKDESGSTLNLGEAAPSKPSAKPRAYRVHLEVLSDFNAAAPRYGAARAFGKIIAEPLPEQGIVRVLLGDFDDPKTANEVAIALRAEGSFPQAFVVQGD